MRVSVPRLAAFLAVSLAQTTPDFSGRWVLDSVVPAGADAARELVVTQTVARTNVTLIERVTSEGGETQKLEVGKIGGSTGGIAAGGAPQPASRSEWSVQWHGERLVIFRRSEIGTAVRSHYEEWELDTARRLVITTRTRGGETTVTEIKATYRRAP